MEIIPVIDIYRQQVVHAVAGNRDLYKPLESKLTASCHPLDVARAFRNRFGFERIYLADIDGIRDGIPNVEMHRQIANDGFQVLLDTGLTSEFISDLGSNESFDLPAKDSTQYVIGLESITSLALIQELGKVAVEKRLLFSLDLKNGNPITRIPVWAQLSPLKIVCHAIESGFRELIVLDLAAVGVSQGCPTLALCREIRAHCDQSGIDCRIMTGGGIRNQVDLAELERAGVNSALISTALHSNKLLLYNSSNTIG